MTSLSSYDDKGSKMCGIAGIWRLDGSPVRVSEIVRMTTRLSHRGPDDEGFVLLRHGRAYPFTSEQPDVNDCSLGFGHRRLSILDLSAAGHQPMQGPRGTWIVYNGELFNYIELRSELQCAGYTFKSATDTEVILAAWDYWKEDCLVRFNGMFAFAIWDPDLECLFCARDRFGVKPFLYIFEPGRYFAFASEIKALAELKDFSLRPDARSVFHFIQDGCNDFGERTFFAGIRSIPPSHYLRLTPYNMEIVRWWDLREYPEISRVEITERFTALLRDGVRLRLRSDVPVGSCLSGGIDSASIVAMVEEIRKKEVMRGRHRTFTVDFVEPQCDERAFVDIILAKGGLENRRITMSCKDLPEAIEECLRVQDEPFISLSPVAHYKLMQIVRPDGIVVLLNGQGADELLAGYEGFVAIRAIDLLSQGRLFEALVLLASPAGRRSLKELKFKLGYEKALVASQELVTQARLEGWVLPRPKIGRDRLHRALYRSLFMYHLPSYLRYEDRNSMAFGIETRQPFLDYRLAEYCWSLSAREKVAPDGTTKSLLRKAMRDLVPGAILERKDKMGFVTPDLSYFCGPLAAWFSDRIRAALKRKEWFDGRTLLDQEKQFLSRPSWGTLQPLWRAVITAMWMDQWRF